ncbi:MAG: hypothetical protein M1820_005937 [Bogoriella megaspora]|nr:MAG: hypothetical protein M1820_005937 [Bogoriella megaspora]
MSTYVENSVWFYDPNKAAPILFIILFFLTATLHTYQTLRYRAWSTTLLVPLAGYIFLSGLCVRLAGAYNPTSLGIVIASTVLVLTGPVMYAAANYFILGRTLHYIPWLSPIHPGRVVTTFLALDGVCEVLIGNGASRVANRGLTPKERDVGNGLVKASLILQAVVFVGFYAVAGIFHSRAIKAGVLNKNLKIVLYTVYVSAGLITVRCIYRVVEYFEGYTGTVYTHEVYFWVFEAASMLLNSVLLNIFHPARYLPQSNKVYLHRDGVEKEGPGWQDKRPFLLTLFDPFDICGLITGRDRKNRYWEDGQLDVGCSQQERQGQQQAKEHA